jgi:hypothetical protein
MTGAREFLQQRPYLSSKYLSYELELGYFCAQAISYRCAETNRFVLVVQ